MKNDLIYSLTEEAQEFFAPAYANQFFKVVDSRTAGRRVIRAVALLADGSTPFIDGRTFEADASELKEVK